MGASMHEEIRKALALMRVSPPMEEYEIYSALVRNGIEPRSAARLVEFLPLVYGRIAVASFGVHFSQTFRRCLADGRFSDPRPFNSEPVWNAAVEFARAEVECGVAAEDLSALAKRSSEVHSVNKIVKDGGDLKGATSETYFLWPEEGPDDTWAS